jgi:uncharacterized protein YndB with AHSA1/START domain
MAREFEMRWEGELQGTPEEVWDAFTRHADAYLWEVEFEPREGGAERGLSSQGGTVTVWDPPHRFVTYADRDDDGWWNELEYVLEPRGSGTYLRYTHRSVITRGDADLEIDACRHHTDFYIHSMGEYVAHFAGRDATYVTADAPASSADGGTARVRQALGLPDDAAVGDRVRLTPDGLPPIEGVVDYVARAFVGVRTADSLFRIYGRDVWGWPVSVAEHVFVPGVDADARAQAWERWLAGLFTLETEAVS